MSREFCVPEIHHRVISPVMNLCKMFDACSPSSSLGLSNKGDINHVTTGGCSSWLHVNTPSTSGRSLWDSGFGTPLTPMASSTLVIGAPRRATMRDCEAMPIPFLCDDDEDVLGVCSSSRNASEEQEVPPSTPSGNALTQTDKRNHPASTPLGRSMRSLNISLTPRRSTLQRRAAQKSVDKAHRIKLLTARERRAGSAQHRPPLIRPGFDPSGPQCNVNPFAYASAACSISPKLESHSTASCDLDSNGNCHNVSGNESSMMDVFDDSGIDRSAKKLSLRQINISRFEEEFLVIQTVGEGQFGDVYKCVNRLDGCLYAIKKSKLRVVGTAYERNALNEVYAHAVLGKHPYIVGYYSSWTEDDRIFVQTEYCNGGNLSTLISECRYKGRSFTELELKQLMAHVASGLKYIHAHGLVHLDIKPDNILIQRLGISTRSQSLSSDGSFDEGLGDEGLEEMEATIFKISDLGQVTSSVVPVKSVDEGDCRYLPCELLADQFSDLPKADVFSLALTVYEAGSDRNLPPNGAEWHQLREVGLPDLQGVSKEFNSLIKSMAAYDTELRPSAQAVAQSELLGPFTQKSTHHLRRELTEEKQKNAVLSRELASAQDTMRRMQSLLNSSEKTRTIGRGCGRSKSLAI